MEVTVENSTTDGNFVTNGWNSCKKTWNRSKQMWSNTKDLFHNTLQWFWLLFLAIVAVEADGKTKFPARKNQQQQDNRQSQELIVVQVQKEISVIVETEGSDLEGEEDTSEQKFQYSVNPNDVEKLENEEIAADVEKNTSEYKAPGNEKEMLVDSPVLRKSKPSTILEESESDEESEMKEKLWRMQNGGLSRFTGLENLAVRSESINQYGDDENESTAANHDDSEDSLWKSLIAKYTDEAPDTVSNDEYIRNDMRQSKICEENTEDGPYMSQEDFSATVVRRLSEILAMEEVDDEEDDRNEDVQPIVDDPEMEEDVVRQDRSLEDIESFMSTIEEEVEEYQHEESDLILKLDDKDQISHEVDHLEKFEGATTFDPFKSIYESDSNASSSHNISIQSEPSKENSASETTVVADFCFKLRPKTEDSIRFGIKEEKKEQNLDDTEIEMNINEKPNKLLDESADGEIYVLQNALQSEEKIDKESLKSFEGQDYHISQCPSLTSIENLITPEIAEEPQSFILEGAVSETIKNGSESNDGIEIIKDADLSYETEVANSCAEDDLETPIVRQELKSLFVNSAEYVDAEINEESELFEPDPVPEKTKCKVLRVKNLMKDPVIREEMKTLLLQEANSESLSNSDFHNSIETLIDTNEKKQELAQENIEDCLHSIDVHRKVKTLFMNEASQSKIDSSSEPDLKSISADVHEQSSVSPSVEKDVKINCASISSAPEIMKSTPGKTMIKSEQETPTNLFSDTIVDETYNMILDKEASLEADESSVSVKKGLLDTTLYDLESNFDSDYEGKELNILQKSGSSNKLDSGRQSVSDYQNIDDSKLSESFEVENMDLDVSNNFLDTKLDRSLNFSPGLTEEEEAELAELSQFDQEKTELEYENYLKMPSGLTQQELDELAAFESEKEIQEHIRSAERRDLQKYLKMPTGLTDQEKAELADLLEEDDDISKATEDRLAEFLAAARAQSGYSEEDDDDNLDKYMSLPVGLTEEEENMLKEGADGEVDILKDEEYRDQIRREFLAELTTEEDLALLDEYEFAEQYGSDFEYDEDYDPEESELVQKLPDTSEPKAPPRKSKASSDVEIKDNSKESKVDKSKKSDSKTKSDSSTPSVSKGSTAGKAKKLFSLKRPWK